MYAVMETGGKQYRVTPGDLIRVERIEGEVGQKVELERVLYLKGDDGTQVGNPTVAGAKVVGRITVQGRGKKIVIFKYKRRKNYRRKQGHRQYYTWIKIEDITVQGGRNGPQKGRRKLQKRQR
ncbi:MAG: 50S ribosomal protein L21 [Deltaproteobacteria bacterium]|nr:MAG: 50S ribosomal protein L21 [Deltaproteobacteria bacterium]